MRKHESFILKPMSSVLEEAVLSVSGIGVSMESYSMCSYVKEALLLKMTGFQEQKLKCIMWEMATDDYDFRYTHVLQQSLGECSNLADKQKIYKCLIRQIRKKEPGYSVPEASRDAIITKSKAIMLASFNGTILQSGSDREFREYHNKVIGLTKKSFGVEEQLFSGPFNGIEVTKFYNDYLYRQRNRLAHNTVSYQENLPTFDTLAAPNDNLRNYFLFYAFLMMMDGVFVEAFKKYLLVAV